ncbi:hypothetical protein FRB95_005929 [Tulasnella sp. JGI-2019a]|nr:hypothetical protein FRB95_005929 [Tulasnella sp. JGI-2019a]
MVLVVSARFLGSSATGMRCASVTVSHYQRQRSKPSVRNDAQARHASTKAKGPSYPTPMSKYQELIEKGTLRKDDYQEHIIEHIQRLHDQVANYHPPPVPPPPKVSNKSMFSKLFSSSSSTSEIPVLVPPKDQIKGLYLYGTVGTGKTMLMDLFYDTLPPNVNQLGLGKRRVHFHAFMIDVHKRIHKLRTSRGWEGVEDPIAPVARDLAEEARILCFDEFQVTDIVDAMILRRLLECLLQHGVVSIMTSNRHPEDLYKNGIQRSSFLPCIDLIMDRFKVQDLNSATDYRKIPRALSKVYFDPITDEHRHELDKIFNTLAEDNPIIQNDTISVWGHDLPIPESTANGLARFSFGDLCDKPLGAADYIEITNKYHTIFITDIPKMGLGAKDKARRFITFIDACYESKTKLFVLSEVPIHQIFSDEEPSGNKDRMVTDHMRATMDDLGLSSMADVGSSSIFSGEDEVFAFGRACSRLVQMGTRAWAESSGEHHAQ